MAFESPEIGGFVEPVPGIDVATVLSLLPRPLQTHPNATAFAEQCVDAVQTVAHLAADARSITVAEAKQGLEATALAAHAMQHALRPFEDGSDLFEALDVQFRYLRARANEVDAPKEGRPMVPELARQLPPLAQLLTRMAEDLRTLRTACEYSAEKFLPRKGIAKERERMLVRWIAEAHRTCFGELPPVRGWFADAFFEYIGDAISLRIGHRVVGEVVRALE